MKNIFVLLISLFYLSNCFAQDTVERRYRVTDSVIEKFYVLKSDKQTKQGPYKAFFRRRTPVAVGNYNKGKKTGTWVFYETNGRMVEKYNYDSSTLLFEGPLDSDSDLAFLFDKKITVKDTVTRPIKIGGIYYGFLPYVSIFRLPFDTMDVNTNSFDVLIELLVTPLGRLADYKVHLVSDYYKYNQTFSLDVNLFSDADKTFMPATLNGMPILSRVFIKCGANSDGGLDFY